GGRSARRQRQGPPVGRRALFSVRSVRRSRRGPLHAGLSAQAACSSAAAARTDLRASPQLTRSSTIEANGAAETSVGAKVPSATSVKIENEAWSRTTASL